MVIKFNDKPINKTLQDTALCIAEGLNNQEISKRLFISTKTVDTRIKKLNQILNLTRHQQRKLVLLCLELKCAMQKIEEKYEKNNTN